MAFITHTGLDVGKKIKEALTLTVEDLRFAGQRQRDRIVKRTGQGIDANGQAFKAYKPAYAKRKAKTGRDSGTVDLTWSGRMLKALMVSRLTPRANGGSFVLGIYGEEAVRAGVHNYGLGKMPQRKFMGATSEDKKAISADILNSLNNRVKTV